MGARPRRRLGSRRRVGQRSARRAARRCGIAERGATFQRSGARFGVAPGSGGRKVRDCASRSLRKRAAHGLSERVREPSPERRFRKRGGGRRGCRLFRSGSARGASRNAFCGRSAFSFGVAPVISGLRVADGVFHPGLGATGGFSDPRTSGRKSQSGQHDRCKNALNGSHNSPALIAVVVPGAQTKGCRNESRFTVNATPFRVKTPRLAASGPRRKASAGRQSPSCRPGRPRQRVLCKRNMTDAGALVRQKRQSPLGVRAAAAGNTLSPGRGVDQHSERSST